MGILKLSLHLQCSIESASTKEIQIIKINGQTCADEVLPLQGELTSVSPLIPREQNPILIMHKISTTQIPTKYSQIFLKLNIMQENIE